MLGINVLSILKKYNSCEQYLKNSPPFGTLTHQVEKLARFWHVRTRPRGHVNHTGTYGGRFSKLTTFSKSSLKL